MIVAAMLAMLASFLWAVTNHIDKFMVNGFDKAESSIKTLMIFSTLIAGLVISPIWLLVTGFEVPIGGFALMMISAAAVVNMLATYFYFKALDQNDASIVVVMFQMIPVFSYVLALIFFHETLDFLQILGSIIIILSAILISGEFGEKGNGNKVRALVLMTASSLCYALYYIFFNAATRDSSYSSCAFWYQMSLVVIGIVLICFRSNRKTFVRAVRENGGKYFSLNIVNEVLNLTAFFLASFVATLIPVALADVLTGFQGAFVFVLGAIGVKLLPKYFKEDLSRETVLRKVGCIMLSIIGLIVMFWR